MSRSVFSAAWKGAQTNCRGSLSISQLRGISVSQLRGVSVSSPLRTTFTVQDEAEFKEKVLGSQLPIIVDFSATWCGPCKLLTPRLDAAIAATEGEVDLAIVDIDDLADIAMEHGVSAVPTVLAIREGEVVDKFVGLIDEDKLAAFIERARG